MSVKLCPRCNEKLTDEALMCKYCGELVSHSRDAPVSAPESKSSSRNTWSIWIALIVLLLLAVYLAMK